MSPLNLFNDQTGDCKSFLAQLWGGAVTGDWELLASMNFSQLAKAAQPCWLFSHADGVVLNEECLLPPSLLWLPPLWSWVLALGWLAQGCGVSRDSPGTHLSCVQPQTAHPKEQFCSLPSQLPSILLSPHVPAGMAVLLLSMPVASAWLCWQLLSVPPLSTTVA